MVRRIAGATVLALVASCGGNSTRDELGDDAGAGGTISSGGAASGAQGGSMLGGQGGSMPSGQGGSGGSMGGTMTAGTGGVSTGGSETGGVSASGSPGTPELCSLPPVSGVCQAFFVRYYFDPALGRCQLFTYGGCGGNENNFETIEACEAACLGPVEICDRVCVDGLCAVDDCTVCGGARDKTGEPCSLPGLFCDFGQCSLRCDCDLSTGEPAWNCTQTLCPR